MLCFRQEEEHLCIINTLKMRQKGVFQKLLHEASDFGISCRQKRCFQNMHPYTSPISSPDPQNRCVLGSDGGEISLDYSRHKRMEPFRGILRNIVRLPCLHGMGLLGLSCRRFVKSPFSPAGSKAKKLIIIQVDAYMHALMKTKDSGKQVDDRRHIFIDLFTALNYYFAAAMLCRPFVMWIQRTLDQITQL